MTIPIEYTSELRLTHRYNTISFTFAALNYIDAGKNKYAYRLSGFNEDWIFTDASRRFATYTNLDPGDYLFQVKASNNDGKWNETPVELRIIITPPFWVTWWFRLMALCAITAAIYSLYRFRLNQIIKLQLIRNRIAHDLHDNIGSTLNSISIYSEVAQRKSDVDIPELEMIGESSRKVMDAMSDIVWTINPENDSFAKIIFRMHSQTHHLMNAKGIEYSFKVDETLNGINLPMQTRQHLYLIYKEAINNVLKYANATHVVVVLSNSNNKIELQIRDNGVGFDTSRLSTGNGLQSMRQRAEAIKAQLKIDSRIGHGTTVSVSLPVK